jgi:signal transduction histidine kinase
VLAGFSIGHYATARGYLQSQVDERLNAALAILAAAAEIHAEAVEWEPQERVVLLGQGDGPNRLRWTVHDEAGHRIDRSPNLDDANLTPDWTPDPGDLALPKRLEDREGRPWRIRQRRLLPNADAGDASPPGDGPKGTEHASLVLTVAAPLGPVERTLTALAGSLVGLAVAVWCVAAILGRWLVRRALLPLRRMVESARGLDASDAGWSLPTTETGDELDELGHAFNDLLERLRVAYERQRRFATDASHQLRTPLTAVIGQVDVALRRDRQADEYRRVLGTVRGQAGGLVRIVEALLFLGRAEAEAVLPEATTIDLADWLATQVEAHPSKDRFGLDAPAPLPVRVHAALLGQLVDNLLDNAVKYGDPVATIRVRAWREGAMIALAVEDAGPGIDPADLPRVFEPFFRSARERRLGRPGVGLGLAVVQRIALAFGGTIAVENLPVRGCRFVLRLPALSDLPLIQEDVFPETETARP